MDLGGGGGGDDEGAAPPSPPMSFDDLPPITTDDGAPSSRMLVLNLFPSGTIPMGIDALMIGLLMPDGPARTKVQLNCYYRGEATTSAEAKAGRDRNLEMWGQVIRQDFPFVIGTQADRRCARSSWGQDAVLAYWEEPVYRFQRMMLDAIDGRMPA